MAFESQIFIFDSIPCDFFGLQLYTFERAVMTESNAGNEIEPIEDRLARKPEPIHYGFSQGNPLEFKMTFGSEEYLDRHDVEAVNAWLTKGSDYRYLEIVQDDLYNISYKCYIKNLKNIYMIGKPVAFTCTVVCDSPYAYSPVTKQLFSVLNSEEYALFNNSTGHTYVYPLITLETFGTSTISVVNHSDNDREFQFSELPGLNDLIIEVDCKGQIISANRDDILNIYGYFNGNFFRLVGGMNKFTITGQCRLRIEYRSYKMVGG